ncbi:hypothetical protein [Billgrantia montanilacus]|uniref:Uncharacterized protein n=1 Tax=Billgrantia montanilacus TaxID=2282305 RepID=A0A368TS56_9GAMM|nr:hypothetical protein [Halomonas montanilacus]RCV87494.1 hypothetical protein DU505_17125 [Halomonas montanilacus]
MPRPKPVGQALQEAINYSIRLEEERADLTDFQIARLARLACPSPGNYLLHLVKEMLVAEMERDFKRFDQAAERFLASRVTDDLLINMSSTALFAHSPGAAVTMLRRLMNDYPDRLDGFVWAVEVAWFVGDLELCVELRERVERLGGSMERDGRDLEAIRVLSEAGVSLDSYRAYLEGVHSLIRQHVEGRRDVRVVLNFGTTQHEDGYEGVILEIKSDLEEAALDRLDDDLLVYAGSNEAIESGVSNAVTILVRDLPEHRSERVA